MLILSPFLPSCTESVGAWPAERPVNLAKLAKASTWSVEFVGAGEFDSAEKRSIVFCLVEYRF